MHKQVIVEVVSAPLVVHHSCRHWYCGYACRADHRVDLALAYLAHKLAEQYAACRRTTERHQTQSNDHQRFQFQEVCRRSRCADGNAQEQRNDIHQSILRRIAQSVGHSAFFEQVTEHQTAEQPRNRGQKQHDEDGNDDRENDFRRLRYLFRIIHSDKPFFFSR